MKKLIKLIILTLLTVSILAGCCHKQYKTEDCPYCGGLGYYTCDGEDNNEQHLIYVPLCNGIYCYPCDGCGETYDCCYCR